MTGDVHVMQMSVTMGMRVLVRAPIMLICALTLSIYINAQLAIVFAVAIPILGTALFSLLKESDLILRTYKKKQMI